MQGLWILEFIPNATEVTEEPAGGKLDILICFSELNLLCVEVVVYLLTHARLFATPLTAATSSSIHGILQARILSGFPFSSLFYFFIH